MAICRASQRVVDGRDQRFDLATDLRNRRPIAAGLLERSKTKASSAAAELPSGETCVQQTIGSRHTSRRPTSRAAEVLNRPIYLRDDRRLLQPPASKQSG